MNIVRSSALIGPRILMSSSKCYQNSIRTAVKTKSGTILPEPQVTTFGIIRVILTVVPGLLIGAAISKNIANFLEENELFVPSDDDDDDD